MNKALEIGVKMLSWQIHNLGRELGITPSSIMTQVMKSSPTHSFAEVPAAFTLGDLIDTLEHLPGEADVRFDFPSGFIDHRRNHFDSYRGYYSHLAIAYRDPDASPFIDMPICTVGRLLDMALRTDGMRLTGWKGGEYRMDRTTPLWVANPGDWSRQAVVGVRNDDLEVVITTAYQELI